MKELLFGTAGIPTIAKDKGVEAAMDALVELGLGAMEIEFVRGVYLDAPSAKSLRTKADKCGIALTVHAPYFINLNSHEKPKYEASLKRILDSAEKGALAGARSVTFHAAYFTGDPAEDVHAAVKKAFERLLDSLKKKKIDITLRPELTGKPSQYGSIDDIVRISKDVPGILPCVDFAHYYARENGLHNSYEDFKSVIAKIRKSLGDAAVENMHIHASGIKFSAKGELKHLELKDSEFKYKEMLRALKDEGAKGVLICESPSLENDAQIMRDAWEKLNEK